MSRPPSRPPRELVEEVLAQRARWTDSDADAPLAAIATAILLEDSLGITLPAADLDPAVLGDPDAVRALVERLTGAP